MAGLDTEAKCGQVLLVGISGSSSLSGSEARLVRELGPGGILLFGFNVAAGPEAASRFIGACQDASRSSASGQPLIVAIDHEGGQVFRFKQGLTRLPSAAIVGERGPGYALLLGERAGKELAAVGVNMALAPVVELKTASNEAFLGERCYGSEPSRVDKTAGAFIQGLESSGVAAVAKHFPGNAGADPHKALPRLDVTPAELSRNYVARFRAAIDYGVAAVLLSHVLVPAVDPERPATLSPAYARDMLKGKLGFDGVVLTDDLLMGALDGQSSPGEKAVEALAAGADLLMLSDGGEALGVRSALVSAISSGRIPESRLDDAVLRVLELKLRFEMDAGLDPKLREKRISAFPGIVEESAREIEAAKAPHH
jgi:beta-N-acetylhexosaminidase